MDSSKENNNRRRLTRESISRRKSYLELLERVKEIENSGDVGLNTAKDLGAIIREANTQLEQCELANDFGETDATFIDSQVLSSVSNILVNCVEAVDVSIASYEPNQFATHICNFMGEENDYLKLYKDATNIISDMPNYSTLFGACQPTAVQLKPKVQTVAQKDTEELVKKVPQKIVHSSTDKNNEENINDIVDVFHKVLLQEYENNNRKSIDYYKYVIDTSSFAATIYNMFYTSFLIRDGIAKLDVDENRNPRIEPVDGEQLQEFRSSGGVNTQMIAGITEETWKQFKFTEGFLQKHNKNNI